ncbi:MAG: diaminopimelate decarboxylase family protein, partial [Bacillota bacterium]
MDGIESEEPGGQPRGICSGLRVNRAGHLEMGGVDLASLARKAGTPLYVLDEAAIRSQCARYREAFSAFYPRWDIAYASKALANKAIMCIVRQEDMSLDVVSGGELYTAISAGFPPHRIYFHGNNKTEDEIVLGLDYGAGRFVVDNVTEFEVLNRLARARRCVADIIIRIRPEVEAHCHEYVRTGTSGSKFGVSVREALSIARLCVRSPAVNLRGIHCHIGSQVLENEPFQEAARIMVRTLARIQREMSDAGADADGCEPPDEIDLGGGLGVADAAGQKAPSIYDHARATCGAVKDEWRRVYGPGAPPLPRIIVEPGRSIINAAGVTLYSVGGVKVSGNGRHYLAV